MYHLAGNFEITDKNREKLNREVLELLYQTGIRRVCKIKAPSGEAEVKAVEIPVPDGNGIVSFNYSIFEGIEREMSTYDTNTGILTTTDRGYSEFGLPMNLLLALQESYSTGKCFLMGEEDDKVCGVDGYLALVDAILGVPHTMPGRGKLWDMKLILHNCGYPDTAVTDLLSFYSYGVYGYSDRQVAAARYTENCEPKEDVLKEMSTHQLKEELRQRGENQVYAHLVYLFSGIQGKDPESLRSYIQKLLNSSYGERKEISETAEYPYNVIADQSLIQLPPVIFAAYAYVCEKGFWDLWDELGIKGYTDIENSDPVKESDVRIKDLHFCDAIWRIDENEFLEYWDERELEVTKRLKDKLGLWGKYCKITEVPEGFDAEKALFAIADEVPNVWKGRLVSADFIRDFLEHKEEEPYQRMLSLILEELDDFTTLFPELPKRVTKEQILRVVQGKRWVSDISAWLSVLTTRKHRKQLFGF